ncbi:16215_t:CDS:2 [Funneliformis mosseae]|uniref:16215_t:CDS:1 n=1 Tax=Funneliformis mosseae TaxID=27381 RepID=A0A9N9FP24_FUNMO|nr:16215_t:CDS:2 [Funneliformis mosseae]
MAKNEAVCRSSCWKSAPAVKPGSPSKKACTNAVAHLFQIEWKELSSTSLLAKL